jgi:hypothetical protein
MAEATYQLGRNPPTNQYALPPAPPVVAAQPAVPYVATVEAAQHLRPAPRGTIGLYNNVVSHPYRIVHPQYGGLRPQSGQDNVEAHARLGEMMDETGPDDFYGSDSPAESPEPQEATSPVGSPPDSPLYVAPKTSDYVNEVSAEIEESFADQNEEEEEEEEDSNPEGFNEDGKSQPPVGKESGTEADLYFMKLANDP